MFFFPVEDGQHIDITDDESGARSALYFEDLDNVGMLFFILGFHTVEFVKYIFPFTRVSFKLC